MEKNTLGDFIAMLAKSGASLDSVVKVRVGSEEAKVPVTDIDTETEGEVIICI